MADAHQLTGRCYCGARTVFANNKPQVVTYCHCGDCRRLSGAPVAAFAGFTEDELTFVPSLDEGRSHNKGVTRWFCEGCGSQLAASYDYLPRQLYTPIGLWDQVDGLRPERHAHHDAKLCWLEISDDLPRDGASARNALNAANP